jgi:hypothetical protein
MAYISIEKTKDIREQLKREFPDVKFSIRNKDYTCIEVDIMAAPFRISEKDYEQINTYYPEWYLCPDIIEKITNICNKGNHDNSDYMTDYFDVGWYFHLSQGKWDKPFQLTNGSQPV